MQARANNRIIIWIFIGLVLLTTLLSVIWFINNHKQVEQEIRTDIAEEALRNPLLAAERFLQDIGQAAESRSDSELLSELPSTDDLILIHRLNTQLPDSYYDPLVEWMERGGGVVLMARSLSDSDEDIHPLLSRFGISLQRWDIDDEETEEDEEFDEDAWLKLDRTNPLKFRSYLNAREDEYYEFTLRGEAHKVNIISGRYLYNADNELNWVIGSEDAPRLLSLDVGNGRLTVSADPGLFESGRIDDNDHALLLSAISGGYDKVWLLYGREMPSLTTLLWNKFPFLITTLLILLAMLLWTQMRDSGPRLMVDQIGRRNLIEHLDAAADFAWRLDQAGSLIAENRRSLQQHWQRKHPQLARLSQDESSAWIAELTQQPIEDIEFALHGEIQNEQDFIKASNMLQKLHHTLSGH